MDDTTKQGRDACSWRHSPNNQFDWITGCGKEFFLVDSDPIHCGFVYCPYCGDQIQINGPIFDTHPCNSRSPA